MLGIVIFGREFYDLMLLGTFERQNMVFQQQISIQTPGRGSTNISRNINGVVAASGVDTGFCHVFVQHTSASLMLCENADPTVRTDLEKLIQRLVPDGDPMFDHVDEGPDDMPAHGRTILTHSDLTIPVSRGKCLLGTWQGVYLWEHRTHGHHRHLIITIYGEQKS
jgi:secondary thiamine-phosphate synthase enzyme